MTTDIFSLGFVVWLDDLTLSFSKSRRRGIEIQCSQKVWVLYLEEQVLIRFFVKLNFS